jgi:hypothetical protein
MTADEARAITDRIKVDAAALWALIVEAFQRRAWDALGYASWHEYCVNEFDSTRIHLTREERDEVVCSLRDAGMTLREIGKTVDLSKDTVARALESVSNETSADEDSPADEPTIPDLDVPSPAAKQSTSRPQPETFSRKFGKVIGRLQSAALNVEIESKKQTFDLHRYHLSIEHRDSVIWAKEILDRVLKQLTNQDGLF